MSAGGGVPAPRCTGILGCTGLTEPLQSWTSAHNSAMVEKELSTIDKFRAIMDLGYWGWLSALMPQRRDLVLQHADLGLKLILSLLEG